MTEDDSPGRGVAISGVLVTTDGRLIALSDWFNDAKDGVPTMRVVSGSETFHVPQANIQAILAEDFLLAAAQD